VGWGHPEGWSPAIWIPMKRDPEGGEAKGRRLDQKYQAQMKPELLLNTPPSPVCECIYAVFLIEYAYVF